jgi:predicted metal-dependent hydrolase
MNFINYEIDQLCKMMINDPMIASKVSVNRNKTSCTLEEREHCSIAYSNYKKIKKENLLVQKQKLITIENQYLEKNPKSFRYRTVRQIYNMIKDDKELWNNAISYFSISGSRVRSDPVLVKRCQEAVIMWYKIHNPTHKKLNKYIAILEGNNVS